MWTGELMLYEQTGMCPEKWDAHTVQGFWDTNRSHNLGQIRTNDSQQKKEKMPIYGLCCLGKSEKKGKYRDLARELKKTIEHEIDVDTNYSCCSW